MSYLSPLTLPFVGTASNLETPPFDMAAGSVDSIKKISDKTYVDDVSEKQSAPAEVERPDRVNFDSEQRAAEERRLVRKLDMRLIPMVTLIFIMNYIDVCLLPFALVVLWAPYTKLIVYSLRLLIEDSCDDCEITGPRTGP